MKAPKWLLLRTILMLSLFLAVILPVSSPVLAQAASVWVIPIDTEITPATTQFVTSRVERANDELPLALVFLIDTPGGQVRAMERIVDVIMTQTDVPTITVVQNAFSAGALIAMSAESLVMLPGSAIGAALPVAVTPVGVSPVDAKITSALRGTFRSVAEARGRDPRIAEAMVDPSIEIPGLSAVGELLTLTARQAVDNGIADLQASTLRDALDQLGYGGAAVTRIEPNLTERLGTILASPVVIAILLVLGIGGIVLEFFTPGFGFPGAIGILALALLAATTLIATPAGIIDVLLIIAGVILIVVEVFLVPGTIVAAVLGLAAISFAVIRIFQDESIAVLGWTALFGSALLAALLWLFPRTRMASRLMLSTRLVTPDSAAGEPGKSPWDELLGQTGTATSDLRPAGVARIGGERVDVVTQGDFIPVGSRITVRRIEGNRIIVSLAETDETQASD
jgi:membrane-bound serine protease (ClpP class)